MIDVAAIRSQYVALSPFLDERTRRLVVASEANAAGHGGIAATSVATGVAGSTIGRGLVELTTPHDDRPGRVRRPGAGRKPAATKQQGLLAALQDPMSSAIRGGPEAALLWVSRSQRHLAEALSGRGFKVSHKLVGRLLSRLGFSLQANHKTHEGSNHLDRDAQFEHFNARIKAFQAKKQPAISVDTKKKELVGDFKNGGRELRPKGEPESVRVHDFKIPELGKAVPHDVNDIAANAGWVSVGIDHDTAAFAVEIIRRWWQELGQSRYPRATRLLITTDCGGSDGVRVRVQVQVRKRELQKLVKKTGIAIAVAHLPPGTSKWNRIEHRPFAFITRNWRGKPLVSHQLIVQLIGATTTTGLRVACRIDGNLYPKGVTVCDNEIDAINLRRDKFHGEWNYTISPSLDSG